MPPLIFCPSEMSCHSCFQQYFPAAQASYSPVQRGQDWAPRQTQRSSTVTSSRPYSAERNSTRTQCGIVHALASARSGHTVLHKARHVTLTARCLTRKSPTPYLSPHSFEKTHWPLASRHDCMVLGQPGVSHNHARIVTIDRNARHSQTGRFIVRVFEAFMF